MKKKLIPRRHDTQRNVI